MEPYRVRAYNTATASANKIHDDMVARRLGFSGGLVPGVDVYAYLAHLPAERWDRAWVERGTMSARFLQPVYDGQEVEVRGTAETVAEMSLTLVNPDGDTCAVGSAALPQEPPLPPSPGDWPSGPVPDDPPPASEEALRRVADSMGVYRATFRAERAGEYLDDVHEHLPLFRSGDVAHPAWLLRTANFVLSSNVRLGPWIHVSSAVTHLSAVTDGEVVETRARVVNLDERKGHRLVTLDVLVLADGRPAMRVDHTAIYEPRGAGA